MQSKWRWWWHPSFFIVDDTKPLRHDDEVYHHQIIVFVNVINDAAHCPAPKFYSAKSFSEFGCRAWNVLNFAIAQISETFHKFLTKYFFIQNFSTSADQVNNHHSQTNFPEKGSLKQSSTIESTSSWQTTTPANHHTPFSYGEFGDIYEYRNKSWKGY